MTHDTQHVTYDIYINIYICIYFGGWHQCYYPHTSKDSVSPVCGIFSLKDITQQLPERVGGGGTMVGEGG